MRIELAPDFQPKRKELAGDRQPERLGFEFPLDVHFAVASGQQLTCNPSAQSQHKTLKLTRQKDCTLVLPSPPALQDSG